MTDFKGIDVDDNNLLFAVPKKGRLYDRVLKVLAGAGLDYVRLPRLDIANVKGLPITLVFLPAHDIAEYVAEGRCDLGITGQDIVAENEVTVETLLDMGFGKCALAVQGPVVKGYKSAKALSGGRIVTSFPKITKAFFDKIDDPKNPTKIRYVTGSVEVACSLGIADGVVDLVETGTTMRAAGLEIIETIMTSQTVLITKKVLPENKKAIVARIRNRIQGYLTSTLHVMCSYNVHETDLHKALAITPGMEGPTVTTLAKDDWRAVSALIKTKEASEIMDRLADAGAKSILLTSLANCRFPSSQDASPEEIGAGNKRQKK